MTEIPYQYQGNNNNGKPKIDYLNKIASKTDEELLRITEDMIWLSAFASNNRRSDYHWQVGACYDEWVKRGKAEQYALAHDKAMKSVR